MNTCKEMESQTSYSFFIWYVFAVWESLLLHMVSTVLSVCAKKGDFVEFTLLILISLFLLQWLESEKILQECFLICGKKGNN